MTTWEAVSVIEGMDGEVHSDEELVEAWQALIDDGTVWDLQGWYGRTALAMLEAGKLHIQERKS